jgi:hypothetical protein
MKDVTSTCRAIQTASTQEQVVAAVREYVASLTPEEAALMPVGLTTLSVSHVDEVVHSALQLVHREMLAVVDAPEAALLKDASLVFSTAAQRLAALALQPGELAKS